jgi:hypothetical protein
LSRPSPPAPVFLALLVGLLAALGSGCERPIPEQSEPVSLFVRHPLEPIYMEDRATEAERAAAVEMAATPGEYESASLGVRALVELSGARLVVSPVRTTEGAEIPADAFELKATRYIEPYKRWRPQERHPRLPGWLDRVDEVDVAAGTSRQLWLTVRVPDDAPAGRYEGTLTLTAREGLEPSLTKPIALTVYPFRLGEASPSLFLYGDNFPLSDESFATSRAYGMNTISVNHGWTRQIETRWDDERGLVYPSGMPRITDVVERARQHGLAIDHPPGVVMYVHLTDVVPHVLAQAGHTHPHVKEHGELDYDLGYEVFREPDEVVDEVFRHWQWRGGRGPHWPYHAVSDPAARPTTEYGQRVYRAWVDAFEAFDAVFADNGWPKPWYYLIDEPHHSRGAMRMALTMLRAADDAGADAFVTCNEPTMTEPDEDELWFEAVGPEPALRLEPWVDVRSYANKYLGDATAERTHEAGDVYGTYINIYGNQPASVRYQAGYLAWRIGLEHVMFWSWGSGRTENDDGTHSFLRDWEAAREGIDDLKYLEALERALEAGRGSADAREAARETLEDVRDAIVPSVRDIGRVDNVTGRWVPGSRSWAPERFDEARRRVAEALSAIVASEAGAE